MNLRFTSLVIFLITVTLWIISPFIKDWTSGKVDLSIQMVALMGAVLLFLPRINVLTWKEAQRDIEWGGIILPRT